MRYLSLFSGIEACTVAWKSLGWEAAAFAEFDDFPKAVLKAHYPDVPDLGDVTKITEDQIKALGHIDLVVGGSPCQDLSIAGKRAGLEDEEGNITRSGLFGEQMRLFEIARKNNGARFLLWENVPGAFSSNKGNDFAFILGSMVRGNVSVPQDGWRTGGTCVSETGDRIAEWRVLDAQYFGVAQRRRRVFVVLDAGAWWSRPPVLFEPESLQGNPPKSGNSREEAASGAGEGSEIGCGRAVSLQTGHTKGNGDGFNDDDVSYTLSRAQDNAVAFEPGCAKRMGDHIYDDGISPTLRSNPGDNKPAVAYCIKGAAIGRNPDAGPQFGEVSEKSYTENCTEVHAVAFAAEPVMKQQTFVAIKEKGKAFGFEPKQQSMKVADEKANPLTATTFKEPQIVMYENHANDSRVTECKDGNCPTLSSRMGTGGGNVPFVGMSFKEKKDGPP